MANFQKIKTLVKERGMTLSELAERINMTPTGLGILVKSPRAMTDSIENIARELGVPVGVFFDDPMPDPDEEKKASELLSIISQKDEIIAQKDQIIAQKDAIIDILTKTHR